MFCIYKGSITWIVLHFEWTYTTLQTLIEQKKSIRIKLEKGDK